MDEEDSNPVIKEKFGIHILRTLPARNDPNIFERAASRAWLDYFGPNDEPEFVDTVGSGMTVLAAYGNAVVVLVVERAKLPTLPEPICFIPESASSHWKDCPHHLYVGLAYDFDTDQNRLAQLVSSLICELLDDWSMAIYHRYSRTLWQVDRALIQTLRTNSSAIFDKPAL